MPCLMRLLRALPLILLSPPSLLVAVSASAFVDLLRLVWPRKPLRRDSWTPSACR